MASANAQFKRDRSRYVVLTHIIVTVPVFAYLPDGPTQRIVRKVAKRADDKVYTLDAQGVTRRMPVKQPSKRVSWRSNVAKYGYGALTAVMRRSGWLGYLSNKHRDFMLLEYVDG